MTLDHYQDTKNLLVSYSARLSDCSEAEPWRLTNRASPFRKIKPSRREVLAQRDRRDQSAGKAP